MLVELAVENLGVIESVRIQFRSGLCALTGETGAGKTMLVEALQLLAGGRADPARVRPGAVESMVEGLFSDGVSETVIRRVVPADGRSRGYIDGQLVTAAVMAERAAEWIELHGQHSQQELLSAGAQRRALDRFGSIDTTALDEALAACADLRAQREQLGGDERSRAHEIDLLRYQLAEIESVAPSGDDEDERLDAEEAVLAGAEDARCAAEAAVERFRGEGGLVDLLSDVTRELGHHRAMESLVDRSRALVAEADDLSAELRSLAETLQSDPERLDWVRQRRQTLKQLCRKYGDTLADVAEFERTAAAQLVTLESHDERALELDRALERSESEAARQANAVCNERSRVAAALAVALTARLRGLALGGATISIVVTPSPRGGDVEFQLAANPGVPAAPLVKAASGGELSRIMLALRLELAGGPATMVFDEVDAGVGGAAAVSVGAALADVAQDRQVLVVTHLPQVAAVASQQFRVEKSVDTQTTTTVVSELDAQSRVEEIARMLSGQPDSASARAHAEELLASRAQPSRN